MNTTAYIENLITESNYWAIELEQYAKEHRIPIIDQVTLQFLLQLIQLKKPTTVLEIGTAIGYSALQMHEVLPNAHITTIEKNEQMYGIAKCNIKKYAHNNRISIIHGDATHIIEHFPKEKMFDFVFIDAAKGQYEQYVSLVEPHLENNSLLIADNVLFRNFVSKERNEIPKRYKTLVRKLQSFNEHMMKNEMYRTSIVPIGDGLLISLKIK